MNDLDNSLYAYPAMRKYPVHTKEAALNAYQQFKADRASYSQEKAEEIEAVFKKAASYYDMDIDPQTKQAAEPRDTVDLVADGDDYISMDVIKTVQDVQKAASYILTKRASMRRAQLKEAAKYVIWAAANSSMPLDSPALTKLAKIAGIGVGNRDDIIHEFEKRATMNIFDGADKEAFWKYAQELREMADEDFYKEATLNTVCDCIEKIDCLYGNQDKYGSSLRAPEDVCFGETMDDLLKEANDLSYIKSIDTTISKSALLERKTAANAFLKAHFGQENELEGDGLVNKVASLDAKTAEALLEAIQ